MSDLSTLSSARVRLEKAGALRLRELLHVEAQSPPPCWGRPDFLAAFQAAGTGAAVAEAGGRVVGFALYRALPPPGAGGVLELLRRCRPWAVAAPVPRYLELLRLSVLPDWRRQGVGRALLREVQRDLGQGGGCVRTVVPESNLPVQLLLRGAGYKAVRVLRGHFGGEDGYLMERPCG
jgi:ribosomal protein S18 acetylase RimI-like enzyme